MTLSKLQLFMHMVGAADDDGSELGSGEEDGEDDGAELSAADGADETEGLLLGATEGADDG